jgi:hypothetical protein
MNAELAGTLFEVELTSPRGYARSWARGRWVEHHLMNEEVLFHPDSRLLNKTQTAVFKAFGPNVFGPMVVPEMAIA